MNSSSSCVQRYSWTCEISTDASICTRFLPMINSSIAFNCLSLSISISVFHDPRDPVELVLNVRRASRLRHLSDVSALEPGRSEPTSDPLGMHPFADSGVGRVLAPREATQPPTLFDRERATRVGPVGLSDLVVPGLRSSAARLGWCPELLRARFALRKGDSELPEHGLRLRDLRLDGVFHR